ncbi:hypothetical protein ACSDR0_49640 [Streptosporangium sp. G11]|uniref:hypothetical protein n=1 Tax=Streptosporangium sp. G11 TaxID=3436926 RepID=UPI003EB95152
MINAMPVEGIAPDPNAKQPADLVVRNGRVYTQDPARPTAAAIAVRDGRIAAVGDDQNIAPFVGTETRVVDTLNRQIISGLNDSHLHVIRGGLNYLLELRWDGVPSLRMALWMGGFHRTVPPTLPSGVRQAQALVEAAAESEEHRQWRAARGFTKDRTSYDEIFDSCFVL